MPTYIMLSTLTEGGARTVSEKPERIREVDTEVEKLGLKIVTQYALLGPYDFLTVIEAPDNETVAKVSAHIASRGSVKIMTLGAIPVDSFIARLKE